MDLYKSLHTAVEEALTPSFKKAGLSLALLNAWPHIMGKWQKLTRPIRVTRKGNYDGNMLHIEAHPSIILFGQSAASLIISQCGRHIPNENIRHIKFVNRIT